MEPLKKIGSYSFVLILLPNPRKKTFVSFSPLATRFFRHTFLLLCPCEPSILAIEDSCKLLLGVGELFFYPFRHNFLGDG